MSDTRPQPTESPVAPAAGRTNVYDFERKNRHFNELFRAQDLRWLGQNTNHFPSPPEVKAALLKSIEKEEYHAYAPPAGLEELHELIRADMGLPETAVFVTDGAIEALYHVCRTLLKPGDEFIATDPGWKWPLAFAAENGARVTELPIYEPAQAYRLSPDQLRRAVGPGTKLIYLIDPNNPMGFAYSAAEIAAFAEIARSVGAYVVHDCTYRHFADDHTLLARHYPERTVTTYSFSKWLGLAGLRLGAMLAAPEIIETLAKAPPNNLGSNLLAQRAAIAGLKVKAGWFPEVQRRQRANQERIRNAVVRVAGFAIPIYPSQGNFLAVDVSAAGVRPDALCEIYLRHKILIRQAGYHSRRYADRFVKVSTTVPEEWIEEFCALLPEAAEAARRAGAQQLF